MSNSKSAKIKIMFNYKGIDHKGELRTGIIEAESKIKAFELLKNQGIKPLEIKKKEDKLSIKTIFRLKPSDEEISYLLIQLSIMLSSGLTLTQALENLSSQTDNKKTAQALLSIKEDIEKGVSIPKAFRNSMIFPDFLIEMLKVAERGENLEKIFKISSDFLSRSSDLKNRILTSLTYPIFVIVLSLLSVLLIVNLIIPKITQVLMGLGKSLPPITKFLLMVSRVLGYLIYLLPVITLFLFFRNKIFKKESLSQFYLKIPVLGKVSFFFNLSRFSRMLCMCLNSGIPIVKSINLSIGSISNAFLREKLKFMSNEVLKGKSLKNVFSETGVFPEIYLNLIQIGEKSGEIEKVLGLLSEIYDRQAVRIINLWLRLIEPLSILIIGLIVAFIVISVILPLTEISTGIKK